jgi:hypothetical protein
VRDRRAHDGAHIRSIPLTINHRIAKAAIPIAIATTSMAFTMDAGSLRPRDNPTAAHNDSVTNRVFRESSRPGGIQFR